MKQWIFLAIQLPALSLAAWAALRFRKARQAQESLLDRNRADLDGKTWFRVYVSRPQRFQRIFKLQVFDARGLLVLEESAVRLLAALANGDQIDRRYARPPKDISWVGNPTLGSANLHWFTLGRGEQQFFISADTGLNAVSSRQTSGDLFRNLAGTAVALPPRTDFALEKNPASLVASVIFFAFLAYAILDGLIFNKAMLIGSTGFVFAPIVGLLAIPVGYLLLSSHRVPARESLVLSMLCGFAIAGAFLPFVKRVDQWTAPGDYSHYQYVLESAGRLHPVDDKSDLPKLDFSGQTAYWVQFKPGSTHEFELRRGGLGLWQLNGEPFNEKLRAFYERSGTK